MNDYRIDGLDFANVLDVKEQLAMMQGLLHDQQPFCHLRFNDGEAKTAFGMVPENCTTSGEHHCFKDLGQALLNALDELLETAAADPTRRVLLGSYLFREQDHPGAIRLLQHLHNRSAGRDAVTWCPSDLWYSTEGEEQGKVADVLPLLTAIRQDTRRKVLIGSGEIENARYCLGARQILIPHVDAWDVRKRVMDALEPLAKEAGVFFWCAGLPGKVWMWDLFRRYPLTTHLDFGHFFDGCFGGRNRAWLRDRNEHHWGYLQSVLIPHVKMFTPNWNIPTEGP